MSDIVRKWWRMRKWRRSDKLTDSELAVVRALLPKGDWRTERLMRQVQCPPCIERTLISPQRCQVRIPYVHDSRNLIEASRDYYSPPISVTDRKSNSQIEFTLKLQRGGYLNEMVGVVINGNEWPFDWEADVPQVSESQPGWLPPEIDDSSRQEIVRRLAVWAGVDPGLLLRLDKGYLVVFPPVTAQQVAQAEKRTGHALPKEYLHLLGICNGFTVVFGRPYDVFGLEDIHIADQLDNREPGFVITDLYEDGIIIMQSKPDGTIVFRWSGQSQSGGAVIGDLKEYIRDTLEWAIRDEKAGE